MASFEDLELMFGITESADKSSSSISRDSTIPSAQLGSSLPSTVSTPSSSQFEISSPIPSGQKIQRRRSFSTSQKLEALELMDKLGSLRAAAKQVGVSRRQLQYWFDAREELEASLANGSGDRSRLAGGGRKVTSLQLEYQLSSKFNCNNFVDKFELVLKSIFSMVVTVEKPEKNCDLLHD